MQIMGQNAQKSTLFFCGENTDRNSVILPEMPIGLGFAGLRIEENSFKRHANFYWKNAKEKPAVSDKWMGLQSVIH